MIKEWGLVDYSGVSDVVIGVTKFVLITKKVLFSMNPSPVLTKKILGPRFFTHFFIDPMWTQV